jgi:hypothetical protein
MLPAVFLLSGIFLLWRSEYAALWRRSWTGWDWVGFATLVVGAVVVVSAVLGHRSLEWNYATRLYKGRMLDLSLDAAGALTIGLGVLPVVAGLAVLWRTPDEPVSYALRVFRSVLLASIICFGVYTAVKATYVSISFGTYTYERNLIYLAPLLFTGTALWLESRRLHSLALAASSAFVLVLILTTPYDMGQDLSYNAPGLAILQQGNRYLQIDPTGAKIGLVALLGFSIALLLAPRYIGRSARWLVVWSRCGAVVAWNLTGESRSRRRRTRVGSFPGEHPGAIHLGRRQDRRSADGVYRAADGGSERRVADRILEPLDQGSLESRRDRAGPGTVPDAGSSRIRRRALQPGSMRRLGLPVRGRGGRNRSRREDGRNASPPRRWGPREVASGQDRSAAQAGRRSD